MKQSRSLEPYINHDLDYIPYSSTYNRILSSCTGLNYIVTRRMIEDPNLSNKFKYVWHYITCGKDDLNILKSNILFLKKGFSTQYFYGDYTQCLVDCESGPYFRGKKVI